MKRMILAALVLAGPVMGQSFSRVDAWRPAPLLQVTGCNYTHATKKITKSGGFASYTWQSGDVATFSAGYKTSSIFFLLNSDTITAGTANDITLQNALTFVGGSAGDITNDSITVNICRTYYRYDVDGRGSKATAGDPLWSLWCGAQGGNIPTCYFDNAGGFHTGAYININPIFSQYTNGGASGTSFRYPGAPASTMLYVYSDIDGPNAIFKANTNSNSYLFAGLDSSENYVFAIEDTGGLAWGAGANKAAMDTTLTRTDTGELTTQKLVTTGTMLAKGGYRNDETGGAAAVSGVATLVAGTKTVSTTAVTANSRITLSIQNLGTVSAPKPVAVTARTAGSSFTVTSSDNTDTSRVYWEIHEPLLETSLKPAAPAWNASHPLSSGMICAYLLTENTGTSLADATGQMSAASISGTISWVSESFGPALYFNGSNAVNQCMAVPSLSGKFGSNEASVLYILKWTNQTITSVSNGLDSWGSSGNWFPMGNGPDVCRFSIFRTTEVDATPTSWTRTAWHRMVIRSKNETNGYKAYVNGAQVYQTSAYASITAPNYYKIGESVGTGACDSNAWHGNFRLAAIMMWNRALSSSDVTDLESDPYAMFR